MSVFTVRDKKVVLNTHVLLIPEFKALVDEYPKNYINVLSFVNYMTNPVKAENPYLEFRPSDKKSRLKRDFPGEYDDETPVVKAAMERMIADFIDLPEDRLHEAAKVAAENMERALKDATISTLADVKTMADIFPKLEKVMEALGKTRESRANARTVTKNRGGAKDAYDEED